jgi:hypothetical protein
VICFFSWEQFDLKKLCLHDAKGEVH